METSLGFFNLFRTTPGRFACTTSRAARPGGKRRASPWAPALVASWGARRALLRAPADRGPSAQRLRARRSPTDRRLNARRPRPGESRSTAPRPRPARPRGPRSFCERDGRLPRDGTVGRPRSGTPAAGPGTPASPCCLARAARRSSCATRPRSSRTRPSIRPVRACSASASSRSRAARSPSERQNLAEAPAGALEVGNLVGRPFGRTERRERVRQLGHVLEALRRNSAAGPAERRSPARAGCPGAGRRGKDRIDHDAGDDLVAGPRERGHPGQELEEHHPERPHVAARIGARGVAKLLGGRVVGRAHVRAVEGDALFPRFDARDAGNPGSS